MDKHKLEHVFGLVYGLLVLAILMMFLLPEKLSIRDILAQVCFALLCLIVGAVLATVLWIFKGKKESKNPTEEDKPIFKFGGGNNAMEDATRMKYSIGKGVLFFGMVAMAVFVFTDLITKLKPDLTSELIEKAFDAFKIITMTVLGYMFGSSNSKNSEK